MEVGTPGVPDKEAGMREGVWRGLLTGLALLLAACGGGGQPQPDLTLAGISPQNPTVVQGETVTLTLTFTSQNGFQGQVSLSVTENGQPPSWLTLSPTSATLNVPKGDQVQVSLQVQVAANAPTGPHALKLRATYGNKVAEGDLDLTVTAEPGTLWTVRPTEFRACKVAYGNGTFVAAGIGLTNVFVSRDRGQTWTLKPRLVSDNIWDVAYGDGIFVVAMGTGFFMVSRDGGETWSLESITDLYFDIFAITYYGDRTFVFQAQGLGASYSVGTITFTADGFTSAWKNRMGLLYPRFNSLTYGGGTLVGVGRYGTIRSSTDGGVTWTTVPSGTGAELNGVTYGNGLFVAVGGGGTVLTSPDGFAWTQRTTDTNVRLEGVTYGNGLFVAVGDGGTILTSRDGVVWRRQNSGTDADLCAVAYGDGIFLALGNGVVLTSP
jgi:hypothetical protein